MHNHVAQTKQQDQSNHRLSAPNAKQWAAKAFTRCASQQRRYDCRPDGRRQTRIADRVEEPVRPQQAAHHWRDKGENRGFKASQRGVVETEKIRQIIKQAESDAKE